MLSYYAKSAAGLDFAEYAFCPDDATLNAFTYFLADVDTESKTGQNTDDFSISLTDATHILAYYAEKSANLNPS